MEAPLSISYKNNIGSNDSIFANENETRCDEEAQAHISHFIGEHRRTENAVNIAIENSAPATAVPSTPCPAPFEEEASDDSPSQKARANPELIRADGAPVPNQYLPDDLGANSKKVGKKYRLVNHHVASAGHLLHSPRSRNNQITPPSASHEQAVGVTNSSPISPQSDGEIPDVPVFEATLVPDNSVAENEESTSPWWTRHQRFITLALIIFIAALIAILGASLLTRRPSLPKEIKAEGQGQDPVSEGTQEQVLPLYTTHPTPGLDPPTTSSSTSVSPASLPTTSSPTASPTAPSPTADLLACSTPELASLTAFASDLRASYQGAGLPAILGGTSSAGDSPACQTPLSKKKVLMIGVDGLRADVVGMTPLPAFRRLQSLGTYSFWADVQSAGSAVSGPGWASMFTGVQSSKHKVDGNDDLNDIAYPTVFKLAKDNFGLKIAASVIWHPLITDIIDHEDASTLDASYLAPSDYAMAAKAEEWIRSKKYDFVFVDFDGPDSAGHSTGFDGYSEIYQNQVQSTDVLIGKLLNAMVDTGTGEEWLVVLTSDHGGEGTSQGANDAYNRKIPFLVASNSPRVDVGCMPFEDPGSQMDVMPTVLHFLGGPGAVPAGLDGQVFGFSDHVRGPPSPPPGGCIPNPQTCGCASTKQSDYRGDVAVTVSSKPCQRWDSQSPHSHMIIPENYPSAGLEGNYCRNPDGEPGAWCYTTDPNERWELCNVPTCDTNLF